MKRISDKMVELTVEEMDADDFFDDELDRGLGIPEAAQNTRKKFPGMTEEFYAWLAE